MRRRGGEPVQLGFDVGEVPGDRVEIGLTLGVHAGHVTRVGPADAGVMTYCHR
jgi:hypothetical protein